jgi:hypothetical protein
MFLGNYTNTTTNCNNTTTGYTHTTGNPQNLPLQPRANKIWHNAGHRPRRSPENGRQLALRKAEKVVASEQPDPIERSLKSDGGQLRPWFDKAPDWLKWAGEQLADALIGDDEVLLRPKDSVEPATPSQKQKQEQKSVSPKQEKAAGKSVKGAADGYAQMSEFLSYIKKEGFVCVKHGSPCVAKPGDNLKDKVVLIGLNHTDPAGISAIRRLLAKFLRPRDPVVAEITPEIFEYARPRDHACMGAPRQCIPGEIAALQARSIAALQKVTELSRQRLALIDPDAASSLARMHDDAGTELQDRTAQYNFQVEMRRSSIPPGRRAALAELDREVAKAQQELDAVTSEEDQARDQHYGELIETLLRDGIGGYFPIGAFHARNLWTRFRDNPRVIAIYTDVGAETLRRNNLWSE